jgi:hypothetical protein
MSATVDHRPPERRRCVEGEERLLPRRPGPGVDLVPVRSVVGGDQARARHSERVEDPFPDDGLPLLAGHPFHDLTEQAVGEVRVVEGVVGRQDLLGLLDAHEEGLALGGAQTLPDVADRLALQP